MIIWIGAWLICGLLGAMGRSYAIGRNGVVTSVGGDFFGVLMGPLCLVIGATAFAGAVGNGSVKNAR